MIPLCSLPTLDWGDVPSWIAAIATLGALVAAGWAVKKASDTFKLELKRDSERQAHDEQAEQADLIAAWSAWLKPDDTRMRAGWGALIVNGSPLPVYEATIELYGPVGDLRVSQPKNLLPPGDTPLIWNTTIFKDDEHVSFGQYLQVALKFRDSAGRLWHRDRHGQLSRIGRAIFAEDTATISVEARGGEDADE
ncbi:MAG: hypothetical protein ACRCYU_00970 [Nocardioides sp.]